MFKHSFSARREFIEFTYMMASPPLEQSDLPEEEETSNMMSEALRQEDEFLEYLMSFPRNETVRPSIESNESNNQSKVGLDHLDNLCKLMEQLGELREQNNKLNRRVQYLEDLRAIQDMHRQLLKTTKLVQETAVDETTKPNQTTNPQTEPINLSPSQSFRSRARSRSVGPEELPNPPTKAKVSKWTRVKEAFRWEKAQLEPIVISGPIPILPEAKSQDSGIGLGQDAAARLLQVPTRNVESVSPVDSVLSYPCMSSSSSSSEDLMDIDLDFAALSEATQFNPSGPQRSASAAADSGGVHTRRRSLSPGADDERRSKSLESTEENSKVDKKSSKTPWGKVKNIIQTRRDSLKRRPARGLSDDEDDEVILRGQRSRDEITRGQRSRDDVNRGQRSRGGEKRPPMLTITLPSTEELHPHEVEERTIRTSRSDVQGARPKEVYRRQSSLPRPVSVGVAACGTSPPTNRRPSKWTKVKKAFLTSRREDDTCGVSMPCSPHTPTSSSFQFERSTPLQIEVQKNYEELQNRLSQEFHKKIGEWERRKSNCPDEEQLSADFKKKLHEWDKIKGNKDEEPPTPVAPPIPPPMPPVHYHLSPQFRKRLIEWQIRRAVAGKVGPHEEDELHKVLPEDFTKKLQEWEKIKSGKTSPRLSRKDSRNETSREQHEKTTKVTHKEKQLQWLEKELNKVEREKRRLEREREKFLEREARLERMRRAMNEQEQEVLVETSTGSFRFHGISEQFTRRLYEWEQQRGIAPEASTFALLDPKYRPEAGEEVGEGVIGVGGLVRSKSVGSVAEGVSSNIGGSADLVQSQPSSLSLNDVEALEAELEENRVSSEPRLRTDSLSRPRADSRSAGRSRSNSRSTPRRPAPLPPPTLMETPGAVIVDVEDEVEEAVLAFQPVRPETPKWSIASDVTTLLASGTAAGEEGRTGVQRGDSVRSASSYQLLEENMQLLSELKHKEAVCRQLEAEMEQLERKLQDVAATQHRQIERLRQEESDRTDDEEQAPSEERVARLRRSVVELGARRERLQRQGQALQDSFAQAWQQQAALAQSLVGRARLLRQGMAGDSSSPSDQSPSPESPVPSSHHNAGQSTVVEEKKVEITPPCQADPQVVAKVEHLSTQLLTLAEKLEVALSSRTREIQNLRCELVKGNAVRREKLRPPSGHEMHMSASLNSLQQLNSGETAENVASGSLKHILPRQSSEELAELPLLLTGKVLELQKGLSELCAAAVPIKNCQIKEKEDSDGDDEEENFEDTRNSDDDKNQDEENDEDEDTTTTTFVLRVGGWKRGPNESTSSTPIVRDTSNDISSSPVTIRPPLWRRVAITNSSSSESLSADEEKSKTELNLTPQSENQSVNKVINQSSEITRSKTTSSIPTEETRRCSLRRSKILNEENRDAWRQHQYVTTILTPTSPTTAEAKKLKTRRVSDTHVAYKSQENTLDNIFVPTTRKIFSPVQDKSESIVGYVISDSDSGVSPWRRRTSVETETNNSAVIPWRRSRDSQSASPAMPRKLLISPENSPSRSRRLPPPCPRSPIPNRKPSPGIKLMIAKYNQKLSEIPSPEIKISPSVSPWRSPELQRREFNVGVVKTQMEKYQEALQHGFSPARFPNVVQKSASAGIIRCPSITKIQQKEPPPLLKSSSAGTIKSPLLPIKRFERFTPTNREFKKGNTPPSPLDQSIDVTIQNYRKKSPRAISSKSPHSPCLRALKIKKAREEFLSRGPGALSTSEAGCRLSQVSAGSGSSFEDLLLNNAEGIVKSASAGMIHVQASVYKRLTQDENKSSTSTEQQSESKSSKFSLLNIASKFRKVRLRKKDRLNTVSMLCRQSLLVDLNDSRHESEIPSCTSSSTRPSTSTMVSSSGKESMSCPNSPVLSHKTIWIKRNQQ